MERRLALALTLAAATLWGTSFPANDLGLRATDPWTFMAARFAIAFAGSAALALALGGLKRAWLGGKWVWATAALNALGYQLQFLGQELTTPGAASLMINAGNLAVPLFAFLVHGERLGGLKAPALGLAALGVVLVGTGGDPGRVPLAHALGLALTLVAGLAWALVIVLNKAAIGQADARGVLGLTAWVVGLTALLALPGALVLGSGALPPQALAAAAYTGLLCTTGAFALWTAGLRVVTSVTSGILLLWEIVVAVLLSAALGLERLGPAGFAGAACILAAIALVSAARPRRGEAPEPAGAP